MPEPHPFDQHIPVQSVTLGDFELTLLSDGNYWADGGAMFGVVPKSLWERRMPANQRNLFAMGLNSLLVRTGEQTVLIETGAGNKLDDRMKSIYQPQELLLQSFQQAGVGPDDVDVVINTHLHFDHCGWNTVRSRDRVIATFPRARYYVQRGELEAAHEQRERDRISYISANYDPLIQTGQMELLDGDREIVPGIRVRVYPGHTRHMQAVILESRGQRACYISDLIPTAAHLDLTWVMAFDLFPLETIESRKRFYAEAVPGKWLVCFTHDPKVPWARIGNPKPGKYEAI